MATTTSAPASASSRQIPIVCPGHTRPLAELQFTSVSDEESFLLSACHDKTPMLRNATTGDWIGSFSGHKGAVWSAKIDPLGYLAATASGDFSVKVWDAITGKLCWEYPHKHIVKSVDFSLDSKLLATGGHEGLLRIYDLQKGGDAEPVSIPQFEDDKKVIITKCVWYNNNIVIATASDGNIRFWNIISKQLLQTLSVDADVRDVELSKNKDILTVAAGNHVTFFKLVVDELNNVVKGEKLHAHKMPIHFRNEGGASLHPSTKKFVAGGSDLWVRVFDFETGEELECNKGHHGPIRCLRYASNGLTYATGSEDGTIRLWKTDL